MSAFTEFVVEESALAWLEASGWKISHGLEIAPDMPAAERADYAARSSWPSACAARSPASTPSYRPKRSMTRFASWRGPKART